jgi:hypothetical protein
VQIVGVAGDVKVRSLGEDPRTFLYRPYSQAYTSFVRVVASTTGDAEALGLRLLSEGRDYDPDFWAWELTTLRRHIAIQALPAQISALLLSVFAVLAIALATAGRNTAFAVITMFAWLVVVEALIRGLKPSLSRWLWGENLGTVMTWAQLETGEFARGPVLASATLFAYCAVIVGLAAWSFQRRDVAATT